MDSLPKDLVPLLNYLLPGFVTAWIFFSLTSYPRPSQFERVIQALIFTMFVRVGVTIIHSTAEFVGEYCSVGSWSNSSDLVWSLIIAVSYGLALSYWANNDTIHRRLRDRRITRETSYPSEWFGVFLEEVTFIVIHFKDERRLYGWPTEWPSEPSEGHFVIENPSWIAEDGKEQPVTGVKKMLVNVNDVMWIEFLENTWSNANGPEEAESSATA